MAHVNPTPNRGGTGRAQLTRGRVLQAAHELLSELGYHGTTMQAVGERAGVAMQTVKFHFHTKPELLQAVINRAAQGTEAGAVPQQEWFRSAVDSADPYRTLALMVEHGTEIFHRLAPLRVAILAAEMTEPEFAEHARSVADSRRMGMRELIGAIANRGGLRPDLDPEKATDILFALQSHEVFLQLTHARGWSLAGLKAFQYGLLCSQLLETSDRSTAEARLRGAQDTSFYDLMPRQAAVTRRRTKRVPPKNSLVTQDDTQTKQ